MSKRPLVVKADKTGIEEIKNGDLIDPAFIPPASGSGGIPTDANKNMSAKATSLDGDLACDTAIVYTPYYDGYVQVMINGVMVEVGDGDKLHTCYFSGDNGSTARLIKDIVAGDKLYWNGSLFFQLATTDIVDFVYTKP